MMISFANSATYGRRLHQYFDQRCGLCPDLSWQDGDLGDDDRDVEQLEVSDAFHQD